MVKKKEKQGQNESQAIKSKAKIGAMKDYLKEKNIRDFLLIVTGLNTALRINDILRLRVGDVRDSQGNIKRYIRIKESKRRTKKQRDVLINRSLEAALSTYFQRSPVLEVASPLFPGKRRDRQMSRQNAHNIIKDACNHVGLEGNYSAHSLRKAWSYAAYSQGVPIEAISKKLGHASSGVTLRYIGIEQEQIHKLEEQICL